MKYEYFQVNDFVTDHFFQQWVRSPDELTNTFWEEWTRDHPEKEDTIQEARLILKSLNIHDIQYREKDFQSVKQNIKSQLFGDQQSDTKERVMVSRKSRLTWLKLAAAVGGIMVLSFYLLQHWLPVSEIFSTGNGEQIEVALPDGSKVKLNANTTLKVSADWEENREVWLDGEAYFEVEKMKEPNTKDELRKFTVHAREIDVEVLGTSFNVFDRRNLTMVVLEEGVVALKKHQAEEASLRMQPGESVRYFNEKKSFTKEKANTRTTLDWKNGKHTFEATPLRAIGLIIEDNYGLEVNIETDALGDRRFSASVPYGDLDVLLNLVAESMQVEVTKKEDVILIGKRQ